MNYNVQGNKKIGFRIIIPVQAYINAMQPKAYECTVLSDGTLIYKPVPS